MVQGPGLSLLSMVWGAGILQMGWGRVEGPAPRGSIDGYAEGGSR